MYVLNPKSQVNEPHIAVFDAKVWFIEKVPDEPERIPFEIQSSLRVVVVDLIHEPAVSAEPEGHEVQAVEANEVQV